MLGVTRRAAPGVSLGSPPACAHHALRGEHPGTLVSRSSGASEDDCGVSWVGEMRTLGFGGCLPGAGVMSHCCHEQAPGELGPGHVPGPLLPAAQPARAGDGTLSCSPAGPAACLMPPLSRRRQRDARVLRGTEAAGLHVGEQVMTAVTHATPCSPLTVPARPVHPPPGSRCPPAPAEGHGHRRASAAALAQCWRGSPGRAHRAAACRASGARLAPPPRTGPPAVGTAGWSLEAVESQVPLPDHGWCQ